tara:strand:+ start:75 stop:215 length:141 start_codon:yes stop_codon:yes gene_type:complete
MKNLTKESLEAILNDVFKKHIVKIQKPERERIPALDDSGKFVRREL